jgi:cell wall-associated NlpC family hydrolase
MQIALPIELPLERNVLSIGIFLLAGITVFPITTEPVATIFSSENTRRYENVGSLQESFNGENNKSVERDFILSMLNHSEVRIDSSQQSLNQNEIQMDMKTFTKKELEIEKQSILAAESTQKELSEKIVQSAKSWVGVPYHYGGNTTHGVDCSGLVQNIYRGHGIELPRTSQEQFRMGVGIPLSQLKLGDLVFFSTSGPGASHVGIYIGNKEFISATRVKVEIQSMEQSYWNRTYRGSRRIQTN